MERLDDPANQDNSADQSYILIGRPRVKGGIVMFGLSFSQNLNEYLLSDHIDFNYSVDVESVPESILYIPALSSLVSLAWAVGADVLVQDIDREYLSSLAEIKKVFAKWFPQFSMSARIRAERITDNTYSTDGSALLFSAGLDSLTSLLRNRDRHPALICVWGASHPFPENNNLAKRKKWEESILSRSLGKSDVHFVHTNAGNLVNDKLMTDRYVKDFIPRGEWWETVSHGLTYTGVAAPITAVAQVSSLLMASSFTKDYDFPHGSHIFSLVQMKWASTSVVYDSDDLSRQDKIRTVLKGNTDYYRYLHVCDNIRSELRNCGRCEKCLRTIVGLVLEGIDPNECNFNVHDGILDYVRACLENGLVYFGYDQILLWKDIQSHVEEKKTGESSKTAAFFEWLGDFDFSDYHFRSSAGSRYIKGYFYLSKYDPRLAARVAFGMGLSALRAVPRRLLGWS